jgi:tetratricopeptide (TPR) repeat protein
LADVFLSYARPDAAAAARIAKELGKAGRSVWYDSELPAHRAYSEVIENELESAKAVVVLWSKAAAESQWVRSEANRARELGKLVQGRLEDVRLPMPFDQIQCADLSSWRRGGPQVQRSINAFLDGEVARPKTPARNDVSRRGLVVGAAAAGVAATAAGGWWFLAEGHSGQAVPPETAALIQQAKGALWQNTPEGQNQAIGIYRQVAADNPQFAEAWGRLAMAYALTSHWRGSAEAATLQQRARSAAERALLLDPKDVHALAGLAFARPFMGNWEDATRTLKRALIYSPKDGETDFSLAMILWMSGFIRDSLEHVDLILHSGPTPGIYIWSAQMLWSAGRDDDLDARLDEATKLYPTHFGVWFTRFYTEMMGGRPETALAFAANTATRPTGISPNEIDGVVRVAKAIQSRSELQTQSVVKEWMERAHHGAGYAENAAQFMSALGQVDDAFAVLRAYYFAEGFDPGEVRFGGAIGAYTSRNDRQTAFLFNPAMANVRADQRFALLAKELKLSDYWQASGRKPDYLT